MKTVSVTCPSCGAQLDVDLKTKSAICEFCNRKVVLTADDLEGSEIVANNLALAKSAFFDRDMKNAETHARAVLGYDATNIVAEFLLAYIREFCTKVRHASPVKDFFETADIMNASDDEIMMVMQFVASQPSIYIADLPAIESFTARVPDIRMSSAFLDRLLYSAVSSSKISTWFPGGISAMRDFYTGPLTKYHLGKAYLGLYESLTRLEDSPLVSGYTLLTRAKLFRDEYVTAVCAAVTAMPESPAKQKLILACTNVRQTIERGVSERELEVGAVDEMVYSFKKGKYITKEEAEAEAAAESAGDSETDEYDGEGEYGGEGEYDGEGEYNGEDEYDVADAYYDPEGDE